MIFYQILYERILEGNVWRSVWGICMRILGGGRGGHEGLTLFGENLNCELNPEPFEVCIPLSDYDQASVVQKLDSVIHRINHYPVVKY